MGAMQNNMTLVGAYFTEILPLDYSIKVLYNKNVEKFSKERGSAYGEEDEPRSNCKRLRLGKENTHVLGTLPISARFWTNSNNRGRNHQSQRSDGGFESWQESMATCCLTAVRNNRPRKM
jgi:hypothetical protein